LFNEWVWGEINSKNELTPGFQKIKLIESDFTYWEQQGKDFRFECFSHMFQLIGREISNKSSSEKYSPLIRI
jgi:hypothetical protein